MKTYTVEQVRQMVELCYGKAISDRTWRRWRNSLGIKCFDSHPITTLTEKQALWLAAYAHLKRLQPKSKHELSDAVNFLNSNPKTHQMFYSIDITQRGFYGRDLPAIIHRMTGKHLSLRTIYRIAKKQNIGFSVNSIYENSLLNIFIAAIE